MVDIFIITLCGILFFAVTFPFVVAFEKIKNEMDAEEQKMLAEESEVDNELDE